MDCLRMMFVRHRRVGAWLAVLLCCAFLYGSRWYLERRHRRALAAEQDVRAQFDELWRVVSAFDHESIASVEAGLIGGKRLDVQVSDDRLASAATAEIFDDNWTALTARPSTRPTSPTAPISQRAIVRGGVISPRFEEWTLRLHFIDGR